MVTVAAAQVVAREVVMEVCAGLPKIQGGPFHGQLSFEAFLQLMGPSIELGTSLVPSG